MPNGYETKFKGPGYFFKVTLLWKDSNPFLLWIKQIKINFQLVRSLEYGFFFSISDM